MMDDRKPELLMKVSYLQVSLGRAYGNLSKELVYIIAQRRRTDGEHEKDRQPSQGISFNG